MNLTALAIQHTVKAALIRHIQGVDQAVAAKILRELADEVERCEPPRPPPEVVPPTRSTKPTAPTAPTTDEKTKAQRMREALADGPRVIDALARELAGVGDYVDGRSVQGRRQKIEVGRWKQIAINLVKQGDLERNGMIVGLATKKEPSAPPKKPAAKPRAAKVEQPIEDLPEDTAAPQREAVYVDLAREVLRVFELDRGKALSVRQVLDVVRPRVPASLVTEPGVEGFHVGQVVRLLVKSGALTEDPLDSSRFRCPPS